MFASIIIVLAPQVPTEYEAPAMLVCHGRRWWGRAMFGLQQSCNCGWFRTSIPQPILHPICWRPAALRMSIYNFCFWQRNIQPTGLLPIQYVAWHKRKAPCYASGQAECFLHGWSERCFDYAGGWPNKKRQQLAPYTWYDLLGGVFHHSNCHQTVIHRRVKTKDFELISMIIISDDSPNI